MRGASAFSSLGTLLHPSYWNLPGITLALPASQIAFLPNAISFSFSLAHNWQNVRAIAFLSNKYSYH